MIKVFVVGLAGCDHETHGAFDIDSIYAEKQIAEMRRANLARQLKAEGTIDWVPEVREFDLSEASTNDY